MFEGLMRNFPRRLSVMAIATTTAVMATLPTFASPSVNGRYEGLIQTMNCPAAEPEYGSYNHYGYWEGGDYICGNQYAEAGYWVYDYPNWYVWACDTNNYEDLSHGEPTSEYGVHDNRVPVPTCYKDQDLE